MFDYTLLSGGMIGIDPAKQKSQYMRFGFYRICTKAFKPVVTLPVVLGIVFIYKHFLTVQAVKAWASPSK